MSEVMEYNMVRQHIGRVENIKNGVKKIKLYCDLQNLMCYFFDNDFAFGELQEFHLMSSSKNRFLNFEKYITNKKNLYEENYNKKNIFYELPVSIQKISIHCSTKYSPIKEEEHIKYLLRLMFKNVPFGCDCVLNFHSDL